VSASKRYPLVAFFVLAYALSWILESPLVFLTDSVTVTQDLVLKILASNVPSLPAIVLTAMVFGRRSLRKLLGRLLIWRIDVRWYLVLVWASGAWDSRNSSLRWVSTRFSYYICVV
jgi:CAAX protease family protein